MIWLRAIAGDPSAWRLIADILDGKPSRTSAPLRGVDARPQEDAGARLQGHAQGRASQGAGRVGGARAEKEKDLRGKILLVDLAEDSVPSIVKTMMSNPKALRDPRKMAALGTELNRAARAALKRRADELKKP